MNSSHDSTAGAIAHRVPVPRTKSSWRGAVYVLTAATLFAFNGTASKALLTQSLSSVQLVGLRTWIAGAGFILIALVKSPASLRVHRSEFGMIAGYGLVGLAMVQWLFFIAISRMPVSIALLIEFTAPVLIALWVRFVRHESVSGRVWVALAMTVIGLAMVARVWDGLTLDPIGLVCAVLSAMALTLYYLLGEHAVGRRDPWSLAAWSFTLAGLLWALTAPIWNYPWQRLGDQVELTHLGVSGPAWVFAGYVAILGTLAPFGLTLMGLREISAARVGLLATAEPPLAGLVAWPALGEVLSGVQILGTGVVLGGIVLAESARPSAPSDDPIAPAPQALTG